MDVVFSDFNTFIGGYVNAAAIDCAVSRMPSNPLSYSSSSLENNNVP